MDRTYYNTFLRLIPRGGAIYGTEKGYTTKELEAMQGVDIRTVDIDTLRDIRDVKVNTDLPKAEKGTCRTDQQNEGFLTQYH